MRSSRTSMVVAAGAVAAMAAPALAAPAEVDPGFGDDGVVVVSLHEDDGGTFQVTDVATGPDGSVALLGAFLQLGAVDGLIPDFDIDLAVARFDGSGRPDAGFGDGGVARIDTGALDLPAGVAIDAAGRVVLSGNRVTEGDETAPVVGRLTTSGTLDAAYGDGGLVTLPAAPIHYAGGMALDDQGRVAVAAVRGDDQDDDDSAAAVVTRLTPDGDVDQTFGAGGTATLVASRAGAFGIDATADGGHLVAGIAADEGFVARVDVAGALDPDFGSGGIARIPVPRAVGMSVQQGSDGAVVVGGFVGVRSGMIARLDPSGRLDAAFGRGGIRTVRADDAGAMPVSRIALGPGGTVAFTGPQADATPRATVGRLLASGRSDAAFGGDGDVHPLDGAGTGLSVGSAVATDADGRLVLGGVVGLEDVPDAFAARFRAVAPGAAVDATEVSRVAGADRVATAVELSRDTFGPEGDRTSRTANTVVLAAADRFPDALVAAPYAATFEAPLLLNPSQALDPRVRAEIDRLLPSEGAQVTLMGGIAALGAGVEAELRAAGYGVVRIAGEDRYDTSVQVAEALGPQALLLARGDAFPDALAAGPAAAEIAGAVLLTAGSRLPESVRAHLEAEEDLDRFAVGGAAAAADPTAEALAGADRYGTAALVAERFFPTPPRTVVASGQVFPDALAGGARAALSGSPLLLTLGSRLPAATEEVLRAIAPFHRRVTVAGGTAVVADDVVAGVTRAVAAG